MTSNTVIISDIRFLPILLLNYNFGSVQTCLCPATLSVRTGFSEKFVEGINVWKRQYGYANVRWQWFLPSFRLWWREWAWNASNVYLRKLSKRNINATGWVLRTQQILSASTVSFLHLNWSHHDENWISMWYITFQNSSKVWFWWENWSLYFLPHKLCDHTMFCLAK